MSPCAGAPAASPATLSFASADLVGWTDVQLTADSHGAVLYAHDRQYRVSGDQLQPDGTFPGEPMLTVTNGHIVVAMQSAGANLTQNSSSTFWSSDGSAVTTAALPVGQLPDAGVAALSGQTVTSACSDGSGFVLAGTTSASESRAYGAVWTSPDGRRWTKMPVTPNGLSEFNEIFGVACSPDGVLLLGTYTQRDTVLHSWKGRVAP